MEKITIRRADVQDAEAILHIYAWYVEHTAISFEYSVPSLEEFQERIQTTLKRYPYLVVEQEEKIVGYAYAGPLKKREAYDWGCEVSIYLDQNCQKKGIGKTLYRLLEEELKKMGIINVYACITYPREDSTYVTKNSAQFHAHIGYRTIGRFEKAGYKFGQWHDMIWMEKTIGEHVDDPKPVRWFGQ